MSGSRCSSCGADGGVLADATFCTRCGVPVARSQGNVSIGALVGGRYRLLNIVGEGGMGTVYAAAQTLGTEVRRVAVKVLRKGWGTTPEVLQRFRRECGTASKLVHPNAVAIHDFGTTESGELYIAMDLVAGRPLRELVTAGGISPERASALLDQICDVLDEAHALGIVHRDLKPDNILVVTDRRGRETIKLLDFGIALPGAHDDGRERTRLTQMGTIMGTPPYMSPEQFLGTKVDARSDIYSLGIIAYELLAGHTPFQAHDLIAWATHHLAVDPPPLPDTAGGVVIPDALRSAIMHALAKEPPQRLQTARAFGDALSVRIGSSPGLISATLLAAAPPVALLPPTIVSAPRAPLDMDAACDLAPVQLPMRAPSRGRPAAIIAAMFAVAALGVGAFHYAGTHGIVLSRLLEREQAPTPASGLARIEAADVADPVPAVPSASASAPPLASATPPVATTAPPFTRPRISSCLAIATAVECGTIAALKPRCAGSDAFSAPAQARCESICPSLCAPRRRPRSSP